MSAFKELLDSKPSYLSSTFSLSTLIVVTGLTVLCVITKDVNALKDISFIMLGAYGAKKGMEIANGNGHNQKPAGSV